MNPRVFHPKQRLDAVVNTSRSVKAVEVLRQAMGEFDRLKGEM